MNKLADIGIFGGSGFYSFLENVETLAVETPYGSPSDKVTIAKIGNKKVAFLPRHGREHTLPPHKIPYRANIWAMKSLGVTRIFGPCAAGSLKREVEPGHFVVCDQFVDRTRGRIDTFFDGPVTTHVSSADPYCPDMGELIYRTGKDMGLTIHKGGTMVVIQGPRFSTRAESQWFNSMGWSVINMTGYPEAYLAREMEMCYANISLITDYDVGVLGESGPVSHESVIEVFNRNNENVKKLLMKMVEILETEPVKFKCDCHNALQSARVPVENKTFMPGII